MAATYLKLRSDIEAAVRLELTDPTVYGTTPDGSDAHWDRATLLYWFNSGVNEIRRKRPESIYNGRDKVDYIAFDSDDHTADNDTILEDNLFNLIFNYVCWRLLAQDNVDEHTDKKAGKYEAKFYGGI